MKTQTSLSVVQIETVKMNWSRDELNGSRGQELRGVCSFGLGADKFGESIGNGRWKIRQLGCNHGW